MARFGDIIFRRAEIRRFERKLGQLEKPATARRLMSRATRRGAKVTQRRARTLVEKQTGFTARQIKIRALKRKRGRVGVRMAIIRDDFTGGVLYATFVELGTRHIRPRKNVRQAFDQTKDQVLAEIRDDLKKGLLEVR